MTSTPTGRSSRWRCCATTWSLPCAADLPGTEVAVTGDAAGSVDFTATLRSHLPLVFGFVLAVTFVVLVLAFRSVVVAGTAVVLNLLSVGAAYGLLVLVFQHGLGAGLLGVQQSGFIVDWLPLFLFVILFGLSMDYHVFVVSRIREAHALGAPTRRRGRSWRDGVGRCGRRARPP